MKTNRLQLIREFISKGTTPIKSGDTLVYYFLDTPLEKEVITIENPQKNPIDDWVEYNDVDEEVDQFLVARKKVGKDELVICDYFCQVLWDSVEN